MIKNKRRVIPNFFIALALLAGIAWVCERFIHLSGTEYTDNAQIKQHLTPVSTRVQGFIKKIYFEEYQTVKRGDTLVVIEDTEYRLKVMQAEANYQNALAGKTDYAATKARYEQLLRQRESTALLKQEQTQRLEQNESAIKLAEAALNLAKLNLSYTIIRATTDGVTGRKKIHEGELVQSGQTLVTLVDGTEKWVIANYKETQTTDMREGQLVEVKVDAIPNVKYEGRITSISDATGSFYSVIPQDNSAGNFVKVEQRIPVRIDFTDRNRPEDLQRLRAGMNVECYIKF